MASMLSWVARDASAARDAARLAAAAASRAARLAAAAASSPEAAAAASRAARAAAADASRAARVVAAAASRASRAARSGSCVACIPRSEVPLSWKYRGLSPPRRCSLPDDPVPGLDVTDKDLESDEATWALYENWCKAYNKERDHYEMTRRFPIFKGFARIIHGIENERAQLGAFADGLENKDKAPKEVIDMWERTYKIFGVSS